MNFKTSRVKNEALPENQSYVTKPKRCEAQLWWTRKATLDRSESACRVVFGLNQSTGLDHDMACLQNSGRELKLFKRGKNH